jgi:protein O-mannosyl-transferase
MQRIASPSNRQSRDRLVCALLVLITLAQYWPTRHFAFNNYDDAQYLTTNPHVQSGLNKDTVSWAFTTGYAANWHPLTWLSHALDYQLYGSNAGGHHLTGVLFHIADSVLLFLLLRQLTGAFWRCAVVAALFAWHPLHVESVAFVAERKDVLSMFFGLLTLMAYARHAKQFPVPQSHLRGNYGLALLFFMLGLMSKPMLVSLPLLLLLLDYWPLRRESAEFPAFNLRLWRALIREKIPFFALSAASCAITFLVQRQGNAVQSLALLSVRERVSNAMVSYARYVVKLIWPANLSLVYPYERVLPAYEIIAAVMLLVLVTWLAWRLRKTHPWWIVGWAWFVITLLPVIGIIQVGAQAMADRYSYLPSIGLFIAIVWEAALNRGAWAREVIRLFAIVLLCGCLVASSRQIGYWRDSETLFAHAVAVTKDNALAECNLSAALFEQGRKDEAMIHAKEALRIDPNYIEAMNNLEILLLEEGKLAEAQNQIHAVLLRQPDNAQAHFQLGMVFIKQGRTNEAIECFRTAEHIDPSLDKPHANLGIILFSEGKADEAAEEFLTALACAPNNAHAQIGLGRILESRGKLPEAAAHYAAAVRAKPDFADAHDNLGVALAALGKFPEATEQFQDALKLQPEFPEAHYDFGNALAAQGRTAEAVAEYAAALRQQPDYLEAHFNIALALTQTGHAADAISHYRAVLRLKPGFVPAMEKLAWLLATNPNPKLRDGAEALRLANLSVQSSQLDDAQAWDLLAAANAEEGKFAEAIEAARKASNAAQNGKHTDLAAQIQKRLDLYAAGKPYREP